jgi:hypothetical protein
MVQVGPGSVAAARPGSAAGTSFVEWGAVFAGALTATALSFVLLTFGAAIGLSVVSPWPSSGVSARTFSGLAVFWTVAQQIGSFLAGGYVAGRLRARWAELNADEVEFRDGMHGALVWALGILVGAVLVFAAAGTAARVATDAVTKAASVAAVNADPLAYYTDALLRPGTARPAAAGAAAQTPARIEPVSPETKAELTRIVSRSIANGSLADADKTYLATVVSQRTGLPQVEAERRVTDTYAEASRAVRDAANKARRTAVLGGLIAGISLLISLAAAWWAAQRGGHHRDNQVPATLVFFGSSLRRPW